MTLSKEVLEDAAWWTAAAKVIGATVCGFTYRKAATFHSPDGRTTAEVPGWMADALIAIAAARQSPAAGEGEPFGWMLHPFDQSGTPRAAYPTREEAERADMRDCTRTKKHEPFAIYASPPIPAVQAEPVGSGDTCPDCERVGIAHCSDPTRQGELTGCKSRVPIPDGLREMWIRRALVYLNHCVGEGEISFEGHDEAVYGLFMDGCALIGVEPETIPPTKGALLSGKEATNG